MDSQTEASYEHLFHLDETGEGCAVVMNRLAEQACGEWLLPLADDDLLLPGGIATLLGASSEGDIIYSPPLVWGNGSLHFFGTPPEIPSFALIRRALWQELGGYDVNRRREEDRDLWTRALAEGARFVRVDKDPVWVYRFSLNEDGTPRNKSYAGGVAS